MDYKQARAAHGIASNLLACAEDARIPIYLDGRKIKVVAGEAQTNIWAATLKYHQRDIKALLQVRQMLYGLKRVKLV